MVIVRVSWRTCGLPRKSWAGDAGGLPAGTWWNQVSVEGPVGRKNAASSLHVMPAQLPQQTLDAPVPKEVGSGVVQFSTPGKPTSGVRSGPHWTALVAASTGTL